MWRPRKHVGYKYAETLQYKGYEIKIHISTHSAVPSKYTIFKIVNGKWWSLRTIGYIGSPITKLTQLATDYIDKFAERLEDKLNKLQVSSEATKYY